LTRGSGSFLRRRRQHYLCSSFSLPFRCDNSSKQIGDSTAWWAETTLQIYCASQCGCWGSAYAQTYC